MMVMSTSGKNGFTNRLEPWISLHPEDRLFLHVASLAPGNSENNEPVQGRRAQTTQCYIYIISQVVSDTGSGQGMRCVEASILKVYG